MKDSSPLKFRAIGFDWSGVLFEYALSYPQIIEKIFGIPEEQFLPIYYQYNHLLNVADADVRTVWQRILSHFGKDTEVDDFLSYINGLPVGHLNEDVLIYAWELRKRGYAIGLLSNHTVAGAKDARTHIPDGLFDAVLFSAEIGYMKPQPEAFSLLAEQLKVSLSQLMFVDDREKSLERAEQIGYTPILFTGDVLMLREQVETCLAGN